MTLNRRLLLIPLSLIALATALLVACGGSDDDDSKYGAASTAAPAAAVSTSAPATPATLAATATTAAPAAVATTAPPANTPVPPPPAAPTTAPAAPAAAAASLNVTIVDFAFQPSTMSVKAGQAVTVNIRNSGQATHTFSIQNGASTGNVAPGATTTLQFTAPTQTGGIAFRCMIHGSMTGSIMVTN